MNQAETESVNTWLGAGAWVYVECNRGIHWIVCRGINHYVTFDCDGSILNIVTE